MSKAAARRKARAVELAPFDAAEFLDDEEVIAEYLAAPAVSLVPVAI